MKIISRLFQAFAVLMLLLAVPALALTLAARNLGRVVFERQRILSLANENFLDPEFLAAVGQQAVQGALEAPPAPGDETNGINQLAVYALSNLTRGQWVEMMTLIAPQELTSQMTETAIAGFYDWLDDPDALLPEVVLDLAPFKENLAQNALPVIEMAVNALPPCDAESIRTYQELPDLGEAASLPQCRPPEPFYSEILNLGANEIPTLVRRSPDTLDFGSGLLPQQGRDLAQLKTDLLMARNLLRRAWLLPSALLASAVLLGARSLKAGLRWTGWPLLLTALALLAAGMGLTIFSEALITGAFAAPAMESLPNALVTSIRASGATFINFIALPTLRQGLLLAALAILLLWVASRMARRELKQALAASGVTPAPAQTFASTVQAPPPPPVEAQDDDSKPTGMFG
ncbi:MAG: hypothetical protein HYZ26_09785 [Chloroflexi bacterium]|nr:hypothetical protein [Chloroflexota bacterium]